ncbi:MAG: hypothetical protein C4320_05665, partial [Armatimonadota bacterium]
MKLPSMNAACQTDSFHSENSLRFSVKLSIIIVHWQTPELLRACVESLLRSPLKESFEVLIVENSADAHVAEDLAAASPSARVIRTGHNIGYAAGNNAGFAEATGEFLLTLNPDTEVLPDTLDRALAVMRAYPDAGALGARLL